MIAFLKPVVTLTILFVATAFHTDACDKAQASGEQLRSPGNRRWRFISRQGTVRRSPMPAAERVHHQLGFGSGGYTGTAGTKPFRFGISTFGRLLASMTSVSWMMPFR
jgi:hypothetical protein